MSETLQTWASMAQTALKHPQRVPPFIRERLSGETVAPVVQRLETWGHPRQKARLDALRDQSEFLLVVLDACRFDYFHQHFAELFVGDVEPVLSEGHDTFEYVRLCWPDQYPETTYVSGATPVTGTERHEFEDGDVEKWYHGYIPNNHIGEIVDVWDFGWSNAVGTVPPERVTRETLTRLDKPRLVAHYFQPHAPYIGDVELLGHADNDHSTVREGEPVDGPIWAGVKTGAIPEGKLRRAYRDNLRRALKNVCALVDAADRPAIIMGDHGEALGEYGVYSHPRIDHPKIRTVPWAEVEGLTEHGEQLAAEVSIDVADTTVGDGDVERRLQSLGYLEGGD